ncbi:ATP-binding protein [Spirosoma aerophilum]
MTIRVIDNGSGISESVGSKIFTLFHPKPIGEGTGSELSLHYGTVTKAYAGGLLVKIRIEKGQLF